MLGDLWNEISGWMGDTMSSILESVLNATIFRLFYYIERVLCWIIELLYEMFEVFAGLVRVKYNGAPDYLINIFFSNKAVSNIYWAMALIGVVLTFGFAIAAVVRKMFDASGKVQQSLGQIIWGGIRSILVIFGMTAIMSMVLNGTGILMQQVNFIFKDPYNLHLPVEREFTGEEYAAMGRVLCTISNYAAVESKDNRYNMNLCFNDIRPDMYYLQQQGVFEYSYYETDKNGNVVESWQSILAQIATSCDLDLNKELSVDQYNDGVSRSLKKAMEYLRTTANPRPVPKAYRKDFQDDEAHLDRMIFLMGTFRAAKNPAYNKSPSFDDTLRGAYYYGIDRSIYNLDNVDSDFNIGFPTDYIVVWIAAIAIIFDLVVIILNCIARIFNMLFLYLIAPPVIAVQPLDNGGKTKQWMTAFLVQSLSVFGTVIAMRLLLLFLPLIVSPRLVLFEDNAILNALAKLVLIYGGFEAAKKSSSILTGILADSAGWQAVQAGDMSASAGKVLGAAQAVGGAAFGVASFAASPLTNVVSSPFKKAANAWKNMGSSKYDIQAREEHKMNEARKKYKDDDKVAKGSGGSSGSGSSKSNSNGPGPAPKPAPVLSSANQNLQNNQNQNNQQNLQNQNDNNQQNLQNRNENQNNQQNRNDNNQQNLHNRNENQNNQQNLLNRNENQNNQQNRNDNNQQNLHNWNENQNNQQNLLNQNDNRNNQNQIQNPVQNLAQNGAPRVNQVQNNVPNGGPQIQAGAAVGQNLANNVVPQPIDAGNNQQNQNLRQLNQQARVPPVIPQMNQQQNLQNLQNNGN